MSVKRLILLGLVAVIAGCGESDPNLLNIRQDRRDGPDEFAILPSRALVIPEDVAALPPPTPGEGNLADIDPDVNVAVALGGSEAAVRRGGADPALIAHARRFGVDSNIRASLAEADLEFRRNNDGRLLERVFAVNVYFDAYEIFELDQYAELERFRRAGVPTAAAPPEPTE